MTTTMMKNSLILSELHDFNPKTDYKHRMMKWKLIIAFLYTILGLFFFIKTSAPWVNVIFWITFILLIPITLYVLLLITTGTLATNWDDIDYSDFVKRDVRFISSDGVEHFAYIYIPKGVDIEHLEVPLPTIIGFHGWGSHHREMDRYCLPTVKFLRCLYFTFDALGQGQTLGNKNDLKQMDHAREFIELVHGLPLVDKAQIYVVGMSLGAAKASVIAYPNPKVRGIVMLSGPYNLLYTKLNMTFSERLLFLIGGFKLSADPIVLRKYSGIEYFNSEGIILTGHTRPTPNADRVFLLANFNDPTVKVASTIQAIEKLKLSSSNFHIYNQGRHCFEGNEYFVALEIYLFIKRLRSTVL